MALISVNTPYLVRKAKALCLPDAVYDLIIGQVPGARAPDDPDPEWRAPDSTDQLGGAAVTRAQSQMDGTWAAEAKRPRSMGMQ